MNVPSLKVLQGIGFDAAISRASELLGITDPAEIGRIFPRVYSLGLGISTLAPIQMARAYATFGNNGVAVTPLSIRFIEDRNGNIIINPEEELRREQRRQDLQILTPQENYIMVTLLRSVVLEGTLSYATCTDRGRRLPMPMCGKTGTTQNWSDAWTIGFSPYYTTAIWAGFDQPGSSLGTNQSGASSVGPFWTEYMIEIHEGLEPVDFPRPETGLVEISICEVSGLRPTAQCNEGIRKEIFLEGTAPSGYCDIHPFEQENRDYILNSKFNNNNASQNNQSSYYDHQGGGDPDDDDLNLLEGLDLDLDYLYEDDEKDDNHAPEDDQADQQTGFQQTGEDQFQGDAGNTGDPGVPEQQTDTGTTGQVQEDQTGAAGSGEQPDTGPQPPAGSESLDTPADDEVDMDALD
jgi:penicillin-binding protein 1A